METVKETRLSSRHRKRDQTTRISINIGSGAGIILLGGALAAATLVSAGLAIKGLRRRSIGDDKSKNKETSSFDPIKEFMHQEDIIKDLQPSSDGINEINASNTDSRLLAPSPCIELEFGKEVDLQVTVTEATDELNHSTEEAHKPQSEASEEAHTDETDKALAGQLGDDGQVQFVEEKLKQKHEQVGEGLVKRSAAIRNDFVDADRVKNEPQTQSWEEKEISKDGDQERFLCFHKPLLNKKYIFEDNAKERDFLFKPEDVNNSSKITPAEAVDKIIMEDIPKMQLIEKQQKGIDNDGEKESVAENEEKRAKFYAGMKKESQMQCIDIDQTHFVPSDESIGKIPSERIGVSNQEFTTSFLNSPSLFEPDKVNSSDDIYIIEAVKVMQEKATTEATRGDNIILEDSLPVKVVETGVNAWRADEDMENLAEKDTFFTDLPRAADSPEIQSSETEEYSEEEVEDCSEGTGYSSRPSNAEAIWPSEFIQDLSSELGEMIPNELELEKKTLADGIKKWKENNSHEPNEKNSFKGIGKQSNKGEMEYTAMKSNSTESNRGQEIGEKFMKAFAIQNHNHQRNALRMRVWVTSILILFWFLCYPYFSSPLMTITPIIAMISVLGAIR